MANKKKKNNSKHSSSAPRKMNKPVANKGLLSSDAPMSDGLAAEASVSDEPISEVQDFDPSASVSDAQASDAVASEIPILGAAISATAASDALDSDVPEKYIPIATAHVAKSADERPAVADVGSAEERAHKSEKRKKKKSHVPERPDSAASVQSDVDSEPIAELPSEQSSDIADAEIAHDVEAANDNEVAGVAPVEPTTIAEESPAGELSADATVEERAEEHVEEASVAETAETQADNGQVESVSDEDNEEPVEEMPASESADEAPAAEPVEAEPENVANTIPGKYNMPDLDEEIVERMRDRRRNRKKNFQENLLNIKNTLRNFYESKDKVDDDDIAAEPKKEIDGDGFVFVKTEAPVQASDHAGEKPEKKDDALVKEGGASGIAQPEKQEKRLRNPMPVDTLVSASTKPEAATSVEPVPAEAEKASIADGEATDSEGGAAAGESTAQIGSEEKLHGTEAVESQNGADSEEPESAAIEETVEKEVAAVEEPSDRALHDNGVEADEERGPAESQSEDGADVAASIAQPDGSIEVSQDIDGVRKEGESVVFDANSFEYDEFDDDGNMIWKAVDDYSKVFSEDFYSKYDGAEYLMNLKAKARSVKSDVKTKSSRDESTVYGIKFIQARERLVDRVYKGIEREPLKVYDYVKPEYPLAICTEKITFKQFFTDLYMNFKSHDYASQSVFKKIIYGTTYPKKIIKMRDVKYKNSLIWLIISLIAPIFGYVAFAFTSRSMPIFAKRCLKGAALGTLVIAACFAAFAFGYTGILPSVFL